MITPLSLSPILPTLLLARPVQRVLAPLMQLLRVPGTLMLGTSILLPWVDWVMGVKCAEFVSVGRGIVLVDLDMAVPASHTRKLYDNLPKNPVGILTQLRTGYPFLINHLKRIGRAPDGKCQCGATETITHILIDCPKLRGLRQKLRRKFEDRFNNVSIMLGGKPPAAREKAVNRKATQLA